MANRNFASGGKIYAMHIKPVLLDCQIVLGASGAVSSFSGQLIQSVTKSATGTYSIVLQDNYATLLGIVNAAPKIASGTSNIDAVEQVGSMVNSSNPASSGASITIQTLNPSGVVANGTSGAQINFLIYLNDSSVL